MTEDPAIHPHQSLTAPTGEQVTVDTEMIPVIELLWKMGYLTIACCQDVGEATRAVRDHKQVLSGYDGSDFIAYHQGYALVKMPSDHARRLIALLAQSPAFRQRVIQRWGPDTWRMNVPLIHDGDDALLSEDALLHFPSEQIPELTKALTAAYESAAG